MTKLSSVMGINSPIAPANFEKLYMDFQKYLGSPKSKVDLTQFSHVFDVPTLVGIEVEVENIKGISTPAFWEQDKDGSLRNSGMEFKSAPLTPQQAYKALVCLWQSLYEANSHKPDFSWRTSIHFHLNALGMEEDEFKRLILLSLIFENVFFDFVGGERDQNPYCVPLSRSTQMDALRDYFLKSKSTKMFSNLWSGDGSGTYKYAAVNFSRLGDLGTIEFRHLGGTSKLPQVLMWLTILLQLYKAAITHTDHELKEYLWDLNTSRKYSKFVADILGTKIAITWPGNLLQNLMESSVTKAKEIYVLPPKFEGCAPESALMGYAQNLQKQREIYPKKVVPPKK